MLTSVASVVYSVQLLDVVIPCVLQPFAWDAREFLRKKLVGKEVCFTIEYKAPGTGKEYGFVYLGKGNVYVSLMKVSISIFLYLSFIVLFPFWCFMRILFRVPLIPYLKVLFKTWTLDVT